MVEAAAQAREAGEAGEAELGDEGEERRRRGRLGHLKRRKMLKIHGKSLELDMQNDQTYSEINVQHVVCST